MDWRPAVLGAAPVIAVLAWVALRGHERAAPVAPPPAASAPKMQPDGRATVRVFDEGQPAKRRVVFHAVDGSILESVETGDDGKAPGPIMQGAMITVAYGTSVRELVTIGGVVANDELLVGEDEDEGSAEKVLCTAMVSVPALPPGATRAHVTLGTGATEIAADKPLPMSVFERYLDDKKRFRVLAEALDEQGKTIAWSQAWADGCNREAGSVEVKLEGWKKELRPFAIAVSNPGEAVALHSEIAVHHGDLDRFLRRKNEQRPPFGKETRFELPPAILEGGTSLAYRIELFTTSPFEWSKGPIERTVLTERMSPSATPPETIAIDLATRMLPRVTAPALETTSDPARPFVSFRIPSREGTNAAPIDADAVIVHVRWPRTREHLWTLILPPNGPRRVRLPALPDTLKDWRPDGRDVTVSVGLVDASEWSSFDDVRKKGIAELNELDEGASIRWSLAGEADF